MTPEEIHQAIEKLEGLINSSKYSEAKEFTYELLEQPEIHEDIFSLAKAYTMLGSVYKNLSDYQKAIEYYTYSLGMYEKMGDKVGIAANIGNIGNVHRLLSNYHIAIEFYQKSLQINEDIDNKIGVANNLNNIGIVYFSLSDYHNAIEYYSKSLKIYEKIGNKIGISANLGNIGNVYTNLLDYPKAIEYYMKALQIKEEIGKKEGIGNTLGNIGNFYKEISEYPKALEYLERALQIYEEIGSKDSIAINLGNIGSVYKELLDYTKALEYLKKAYSLSKEIGTKSITMESLKELSELYEKIGDNEIAFSYYKQYITLEKEIKSIEAKKQAERFDGERKSAEREKQLAVERAESDAVKRILHNILPVDIADRILKKETFIADHFESVSVLFMDLVGFTTLATIAPPKQLVYLLDAIFQKADDILEQFGLEKIKTIGDGYLAVANVTSPLEEHQKATAQAALQLLVTMKDFTVNIPTDLGDTNWINDMNDIKIRIGIHTGEVVAGIIGKNKYTYDLWGDAVNVASRMESNSEAGRIHISEHFAKSIELYSDFNIIPRGEIFVKGKGTMNTFWLEKGKKW